MVDATVTFALKKLDEFLTGRWVLLGEVRPNAESLQTQLVFIQAYLRDAEEKQGGDNRVREWITHITNLAEDTESVLKKFMLIEDQNVGCMDHVRYYACICGKQATVFDIGEEMKSLKARVMDLAQLRDTYGISNITSSSNSTIVGGGGAQNIASSSRELRRVTSYMDAEKLFVGFEDVKNELIGQLLKDDPRRCVISIHGMGGLGKTTLARSLYNSPQVCSSFGSRGWICVSQEFNIEELLRDVIKSFKNRCCNSDELELLKKMNKEDLERSLRETLKDKRYLVVLDDVWGRDAWDSLRRAFPDCSNGSRVIVTTRKNDVAERIDGRSFAHHLRFLNPGESWDLFNAKLSERDGHVDWCSPTMQDLGKEMVAKCRGLPLAIIVLGGLLAHKRSLEDWEIVKRRIWKDLAIDSVEISYLLSLSYDDLPLQLQHCFLYVGIFREDYLIDAEQVMYLWMAEGFISQGGGEEMEDVAESCLNELIGRSLIQVAERQWGKISRFRIHDLLRDLAVKKAFEKDFFDIYDPDSSDHSSLSRRRRHVVHSHARWKEYISTEHSNTHLQSLALLTSDRFRLAETDLVAVFGKYKRLCVLILEGLVMPSHVPDGIGDLTQLKFFGFMGCEGRGSLPSSIGKLKNLQTFEVYTSVLPPETAKLKKLRHLIGQLQGDFDFGSLFNLRTLKTVMYRQWNKSTTENLVNLRELWIEDINGNISLESISKLKSLDTLFLSCPSKNGFPPLDFLSSCQNLRKLWLDGIIQMLPPTENWPKFMTKLSLEGSRLIEDPIPTLERLPNLRRLDLNASLQLVTMFFGSKSFPQLEVLNLVRLHHLKKLELEGGAVPIIKRLYVKNCSQLRDIPEKLKSLLIPSDGENVLDVPLDLMPRHYREW